MLDFARLSDTGTLSIPDAKAVNPATQATSGLKPAVGSSNGRPTLAFTAANGSCISWPVAANTNGTSKFWFATWFKATTYPGGTRYLLDYGGSTSSYNNMKAELWLDGNRAAGLLFYGVDTSGYNGRQGKTANLAMPAAGTWAALFGAFDGSQATEALRHSFYINWVAQSLTFTNGGASPSAPLTLRTTGAIPTLIGNYTNSSDPTLSVDCVLASKIWVGASAIPSLADAQRMLDAVKPF